MKRAALYFAALMVVVSAVLYLLMGLDVLHYGDVQELWGRDGRLIAAGAVFLLGTILLLTSSRRIVYILGAVLQVVCLVGYFLIAPDRTPSYEEWGIAIKVVQALALVALAYLAIRSSPRPKRIS